VNEPDAGSESGIEASRPRYNPRNLQPNQFNVVGSVCLNIVDFMI
jgi:hypothetical protein